MRGFIVHRPFDISWRLPALLGSILAWVALLAINERECFAQEASLKDRFLAEALPKRDEYERFARRLQGTATKRVEYKNKDGKKEIDVVRYVFKQNAHCASMALELETSTEKGKKLMAGNSDYTFELKGTDASAPWVVTTIEAPDSTLQMDRPLGEMVLRGITPQYIVGSRTSLAELLQSPGFIVERAEEVPSDGRTLARITFRLEQEKKPGDRDFIAVQSGVMLLAPDHHWCPLERTLNCQWVNGSGSIKDRFEYTEAKGGFYILKRWSHIIKVIHPGSKDSDADRNDTVSEYDLHDPWSLPSDSEFRLPAYGLPEPPQWRRQTPWYLWAFGGGAGCLVLGFLIHRRIRRVG